MAKKTVTVCDVTGEELATPFLIGFKMADGRSVRREVSPSIAKALVMKMAARLSSDDLSEIVAEVLGNDWDNDAV